MFGRGAGGEGKDLSTHGDAPDLTPIALLAFLLNRGTSTHRQQLIFQFFFKKDYKKDE